MKEYKIVWIASYPRSGSMWAFNVTRAMLEHYGRSIAPEEVPQSDKAMFAHADRAIEDRDPNRVWVLKVHSKIAPNAPGSGFIHTRRDPRDALISFMRFMDFDFDTALEHIAVWIDILDHYRGFPDSRCLGISYTDIVHSPRNVVESIGRFLGLEPDDEHLDELVTRFSKERVRRLIAGKESELNDRVRAGTSISSAEIVTRGDEVVRVFDTGTGFQSGHVSDYQEGGWRGILTDEQKLKIAERYGEWLKQNGFGIDD